MKPLISIQYRRAIAALPVVVSHASSVLSFVISGLVADAVALETHGRMIRSTTLRILGDASFLIYLWHSFVVRTILATSSNFPKTSGQHDASANRRRMGDGYHSWC